MKNPSNKGGRPHKKITVFVYRVVALDGTLTEVRTTCPEARIYGANGKPGVFIKIEKENINI